MEEIISFGHWLKLRRQALRLTQDMLARRAFCSRELIRKIEVDARRPSAVVAERLADQLALAPQQRGQPRDVALHQHPPQRRKLHEDPFSDKTDEMSDIVGD